MYIFVSFLVTILSLVLLTGQTFASISGHISINDQEKLKVQLDKLLASSTKDDFASVYYFSKTYTLLKKAIPPNTIKETCGRLTNAWTKTTSLEQSFYITGAWTNLGCSDKILSKEMTEVKKKVFFFLI